ncbi:MAG TPA: AmmeMemoRadiSam system radical SAM enzyme [Polyangiaceae bacterium]|jgi:pyruvate formate lyase activating enzyme|nr:AmmeMemoRadiSam system radical SAM enzyme [Polyangiaceae bacterium]
MNGDDRDIVSGHPARYFERLPGGRIRCDACPRACVLGKGQRGLCFVRASDGDRLVLTTYGRSSGFAVDPIEKKPLHHFLPGTSVLSFGTAGCNLTCKFCQNWDISKSREMDTLADSASPQAIAEAARDAGAKSVAFTYNDPTVFIEYAMDVADACHDIGLRTVAVTAGYIGPEARRDLFSKMDAANIDLKAFTDDFYRKVAGGRLDDVKETLRFVAHETKTWLEITTLLIPGHNDSDAEVGRLADWVARDLSPDVPVHFSGFHPDYKMVDVPPTPRETLVRARRIARAAGLRHVYTGNVHDREGDTTTCSACNAPVIERDWYELCAYRLDAAGACAACGARLPGVFAAEAGSFGRRRFRVRIAS